MNLFDSAFRFVPVAEPVKEPQKTVRYRVRELRPCMNGTFVETVETIREVPATEVKEYRHYYLQI